MNELKLKLIKIKFNINKQLKFVPIKSFEIKYILNY